jgi:hypothetical protein
MAYIDPNTGGMLFQILATAFAVFSGVVLVFSRQIRAAIARARRFLRDFRGHGEQDECDGGADSGRAAAESDEY